MAAVLCVPWAAIAGQNGPTTRPETTMALSVPTSEDVQAQIARIEKGKDLDEKVRAKALTACKQALDQLKLAGDWQARAEGWDAKIKNAPTAVADVKKLLAEAATQPAATAPANETLEKLQQLVAKATADATAAAAKLADLEAEPQRRAERRLAIPKLLTAAQQRLEELGKQPTKPPDGTPAELAAALRVLHQAQTEAVRWETAALQKELACYEAERELLTGHIDLARRQATIAEASKKGLQESADKKRREEADRAALEAEQAAIRAARSHPDIQALAKENAELAGQRTGPAGLAAKIPRAKAKLAEVEGLLTGLQQDFKSLKDKEKAVGGTATFGVLLRKQQAELPDVREYRRKGKARQAEIAATQLRLIELRERKAAMPEIDSAVQAVVSGAGLSLSADRGKRMAVAARELIEAKRKNLEALIGDLDTYFSRLVDLHVKAGALVTQAEAAEAYIEERVLWIRSAPVVGYGDVVQATRAVRWLLGPAAWRKSGAAIWRQVRAAPVGTAVLALLFAGLFALRPRLIRRLKWTGKAISGEAAAGVAPIALALILTFVLGLLVPGVIWFVARLLASAPPPADLPAGAAPPGQAGAVSAGLKAVAAVLATIGILSQLCRPGGLCEAHFRLRPARLAAIRRPLWALMPVLAALVFVVSAMEWQSLDAWRNSLGRLALVAALVTFAAFGHHLLRPSSIVLGEVSSKARTAWPYRLRHVWYFLAVFGPVALAVLSLVGFHYTAMHLAGRLVETFWLAVGLAVLNAVVHRWVALALRRLAVRRAQSAAAEAQPSPSVGSPGEGDREQAADEPLGLDTVSRQSRHLLGSVLLIALVAGAWAIWQDSLPALGILRHVKLWDTTEAASVEVVGPDGTAVRRTVERPVPVTLADVGQAILVAILTMVAVRNIPGFLEIVVLQRVRLDPGARYATTSILRYGLAVAGTVLAFATIGVSWSSIQWLVAAMTVGLGFGLQEIFANFVSGLIILFERPVRIGDTVTIGETVGTVTRIRIRATTITDWDRKELVVPNKEFVTGRLVNWSLSDEVLRVVVKVGIAYGSDTRLAERLLYQTAREHPLVLREPKPVVLFSAFGDSSLEFELRVYIGSIDHFLPIRHDLNMAVDRMFRESDITIAFPQRDTHLDTTSPLEIRLLPRRGDS